MILKRYPDGADAEPFFQHNIPTGAPDWLHRVELSRSDKPERATNTYVMVDDPLALLWVVNLGCIDLNPWQSRAATPDQPTHVLFDLDPMDGVDFARVVEVALLIREQLTALGLRAYPKTTGGSGMHLFVPVSPGLTYEVVRLFAFAIAERLVGLRPELVTTKVPKDQRGQRVYIDSNQNGRGRSISCVYSVRPRRDAPVATPLDWDEVTPEVLPSQFTIANSARRLADRGDLFAPVLTDLQELAPAIGQLSTRSGGGE
jgi:bifunctional non-homologous end joining protein LigD